ncbi:hypothetical protein EK904_006406 [Melospiza melodia maxima]|nr:hypothetical protein EK904_006406 [Melospiza melodia maxima]
MTTPGECVDGYRAQSLPLAYDTQLAFHMISLSQPRDVDFGNIISDRAYIMTNSLQSLCADKQLWPILVLLSSPSVQLSHNRAKRKGASETQAMGNLLSSLLKVCQMGSSDGRVVLLKGLPESQDSKCHCRTVPLPVQTHSSRDYSEAARAAFHRKKFLNAIPKK